MIRNLAIATACGVLLASAADSVRAPILVELFTSEGCSSCPPADLLLQQLDPQVIVLSEHVDYWDRQGWKDPFSSHAFTERQLAYADRLHLDGAYTPQMVVDGVAEFVGSDARRAKTEIVKAGMRPKAAVRLSREAGAVRIEVDNIPAAADVMLALVDATASSQVTAGENKGRSLLHVAILRSLRKVASVKRGVAYRGQAGLPAGSNAQRAVVFLQESGPGRICGAALLPPSEPGSDPSRARQ